MRTSLTTAAIAIVALLALQSCTVVETTSVDGTKTKTTTVDPATAAAIANAALEAASRSSK